VEPGRGGEPWAEAEPGCATAAPTEGRRLPARFLWEKGMRGRGKCLEGTACGVDAGQCGQGHHGQDGSSSGAAAGCTHLSCLHTVRVGPLGVMV